jgi:gamma-glutamylcyclotransferase (GGCT)/AIG2-like uncharacterized protein YtfP
MYFVKIAHNECGENVSNFYSIGTMPATVEAKPGIRPMFVYGSLMHPFVFSKICNIPMPQNDSATLTGFKRVQVKNKPYPACISSPGNVVQGLLVHINDEEMLQKLDVFESELYKRITVSVSTCKSTQEADVYIWDKDLSLLDDNEWSFTEFVEKRIHTWDEIQSESDL